MSLRARFALALALLSAVAATTAAWAAYAATAGHLSTEVDQSLEQAAARVASATSMMGPGPTMMGSGPSGSIAAHMLGGQGALGALGLVVVQYLDASGSVVSRNGQVPLPVGQRDRSLARSGGVAWLRTETVGTTSYRVLTQPLPGEGAVQLARDESEDQGVLGSLRWRFGLLDAAVVLAGAAAGWLFARRLVGPLRRLASAAEQVALTGQLDAPVASEAPDETGRLSRAFATMLGALARLRAQQQHLAEDAAHELRTPLTSLRTNVDILRRHESLPSETRSRVLGALDTELHELTSLVDELVELSVDRREEEPLGPVALDQVAEGVVERARERTGRVITLTTEPCELAGQPRALARALSNLVDNALKFSDGPAPVEVSIRARRIEVRDHGPGIALEDLPRVFDRFYRSAAARSRRGSGLGLAIVSHVAEAHGARAFAANHPNGGAVVGFELPSVPAPSSGGHTA